MIQSVKIKWGKKNTNNGILPINQENIPKIEVRIIDADENLKELPKIQFPSAPHAVGKSEFCSALQAVGKLESCSALYAVGKSEPLKEAPKIQSSSALHAVGKSEPPKIVISDKFEGTYETDYNIINIHHSILHKFEQQKKIELPNLKKQISKLENSLNESQKPIQKKMILREIEDLTNSLNSIIDGNLQARYLESTKNLLSEYQNIATEKKIISFKSKKILTETEIQNQLNLQTLRLHIVNSYLDIAHLYIKINLVQEIKKTNACAQCKFDFNIIDDEIDFCPQCGLEHKILLKIPTYSEYNVPKSTDEKNFIKEIKRFQGLQNNKIPDSLLEELDSFFISYGFKSGNDVKDLPLNDDGERIGTNYNMIHEALSKTGNSSYYEDINLILNLYWGYPLPNISELEEGILDDYRLTQKAFLQIPKTRSSSLNIQYRLYKHLQLRGYKCKPGQFKIIKTDAIVQKYAELWKQMCDISGLKYYPD